MIRNESLTENESTRIESEPQKNETPKVKLGPKKNIDSVPISGLASSIGSSPPRKDKVSVGKFLAVSNKSSKDEFKSKSPVGSLTDKALKSQLGIDCIDLVHFSHWEPGGEYIKYITVKNITTKTQKIKYKLPRTRFFSMDFPKLTTLSAGMKFNVPVTFRPVAKETYMDVVEFTTSNGKFQIHVAATLPKHELEFKHTVDFEYCPVRETVSKKLVVRNKGELETGVQWVVKSPFDIIPSQFVLNPGEEQVCDIKFSPSLATGFQELALCNHGNPSALGLNSQSQPLAAQQSASNQQVLVKQLTLRGTGKFSFLKVENGGLINFGNVLNTGFNDTSMHTMFITLSNPSPVEAKFRIQPKEPKDVSPHYQFARHSGVVPPLGDVKLEVKCIAPSAGQVIIDYFRLTTVSGNELELTCRAAGVGPCVSLSTPVVNFGDVTVGTTLCRAVSISNNSDYPAYYQFDLPSDATFSISKASGVLPRHTKIDFTVKFAPTECMNYWRPVYCLVENSSALLIDFIGTGFDDKHRPATFQTKFLDRYKARLSSPNKLWQYTTEQLENMLKNNAMKLPDRPASGLQLSPEDTMIKYFSENSTESCPVTLLESSIDFGSCPTKTTLDSMVLRIANHTKGKMGCVWIIPENSAFDIVPSTGDILPESIGEFHVQFRPTADQMYYGQQIECYVNFKSMRNFRLVSEATFTPPWCLTVLLTGNTFNKKNPDVLIPSISADRLRQINFSACLLNNNSYRIVRLTNLCDSPLQYSFSESSLNGCLPVHRQSSIDLAPFSAKPRSGFLKKDESQCIVFRFCPGTEQLFDKLMHLVLNKSPDASVNVNLKGVGVKPSLRIQPESPIFLRPISLGSTASVSLQLRNTTRLETSFSWAALKDSLKSSTASINIEPSTGIVEPNGVANVKVTVTPSAARKQLLRLQCQPEAKSFSNQSVLGTPAEASMFVQGIIPRLESNTNELAFGHILVNSRAEHVFTILNPTDSDITYKLESLLFASSNANKEEFHVSGQHHGGRPGLVVVASANGEVRPNAHELHSAHETAVSDEFVVFQPSAILPARSRHVVKVIAYLQQQKRYDLIISYKDASNLGPGGKAIQLCHASVTGVLPAVQAVDIISEGLSKNRVWECFHLKQLNKVLNQLHARPRPRTPLSNSGAAPIVPAGALGQRILGRRSSIAPAIRPAPIEFNFGAAKLQGKPTRVYICLRNDGVVPVTCQFCFPHDLDVHVEQWVGSQPVENGSSTNSVAGAAAANEAFALFSVSPKKQVLPPGQSANIELCYYPSVAGQHTLPIVCRLKDESDSDCHDIDLIFIGTAVPSNEPFIEIQASVVEALPVPVSCYYPPIQTVRLYNPSSVPIDWDADFSSSSGELGALDLFKGVKTSGFLAAGGYDYLEYCFKPFEVRSYEVQIPIRIVPASANPDSIPNSASSVAVSKPGRSRKNNSGTATHSAKSFTNSHGHTLVIRGYGKSSKEELLNDQLQLPRFAEVQWIQQPGVPVVLSTRDVDFGCVTLGSVARRSIAVHNTSASSVVSFNWVVEHGRNKLIDIVPSKGALQPGEILMCKVVLSSGFVPRNMQVIAYLEMSEPNSHGKGHVKAAELSKSSAARCDEPSRNLASKYSILPSISKSLAKNDAESCDVEDLVKVNKLCVDLSAQIVHKDHGNQTLIQLSEHHGYVPRVEPPSEPPQSVVSQLSFADSSIVRDMLVDMLNDFQNELNLGEICNASKDQTVNSKPFAQVTVKDLEVLGTKMADLRRTEAEDGLQTSSSWYDIASACDNFRLQNNSIVRNRMLGIADALVYDTIPEAVSSTKALVSESFDNKTANFAYKLVSKQSTEFPNMLEGIMDNILFNIIQEAARNEFEITSEPKYVKLGDKEGESLFK